MQKSMQKSKKAISEQAGKQDDAEALRQELLALAHEVLAPTMQNKILAATEAIWDNPDKFLSTPDFLELIKALKSTEGKSPMDRITAGFPAKMLKDKEKLKLLPLPVKIEKHPEITGTDEDLLVFDWFPNESGTPKEAEKIVGVAYEFVEELIKALDKMPSTLQARSQKRQK